MPGGCARLHSVRVGIADACRQIFFKMHLHAALCDEKHHLLYMLTLNVRVCMPAYSESCSATSQ